MTATATKPQAVMPRPMATDEKAMEYIPFGGKTPIKLTMQIIRNVVANKTKSGKSPSDQEIIKFMMLCQARLLNPFEGDAYLVGYDGKDGPTFSLITAHQAFLKRAEVNPEYDGMESGLIIARGDQVIETEGDFYLDGDVILGGWATVYFKRRTHPIKRRVRLATFRKNYGVWQSNPEGMICKCFDEQTEVLTDRGFEKFSEAVGRVLQVTKDGLEPTDAEPFVQSYSGPMVTLNSDDLNFCVTPNHDMVTTFGKIEAGKMFDKARSRPQFWIPRCVRAGRPAFGVTDDAIKLAAVYLADGYDKPHGTFWVGVSRPAKVAFLESLGCHSSRHVDHCAGKQSQAATRTITVKSDKQIFGFAYDLIAPLIGRGKSINMPAILALSNDQARLFVDTLIRMDGHKCAKTGVRRFYSSRPEIVRAFEVAAVIAGYAVSQHMLRQSDIGKKDNVTLTISDRSEIGVRRWGRDYHNLAVSQPARKVTTLEMTPNTSGRVWCVKVPSGVIVVRRNGFSMLCGNCAEADALRSSFPTMLGSLYIEEELPSAPPTMAAMAAIAPPTGRQSFRTTGHKPYQAPAPEPEMQEQLAEGETENQDEAARQLDMLLGDLEAGLANAMTQDQFDDADRACSANVAKFSKAGKDHLAERRIFHRKRVQDLQRQPGDEPDEAPTPPRKRV